MATADDTAATDTAAEAAPAPAAPAPAPAPAKAAPAKAAAAAPAVEAPPAESEAEEVMTATEYGQLASQTERCVHLLTAFVREEIREGRMKDTYTAFTARLAAFAARPV